MSPWREIRPRPSAPALLAAAGISLLALLALLSGRDAPAPAPDVAGSAAAGEWSPGRTSAVTAMPRSPVATVDDEPAPPSEPTSTERQHHAAMLALGRTDPDRLDDELAALLRTPGSLGRKAAALRAAYELRTPAALQRFDEVLARVEAEPELAEVATTFLIRQAGRDPAARRLLERFAFAPGLPASASMRRRAAAGFTCAAPAEELVRVAAAVDRSADPLFVDSIAAALAQNPDPRAAALVAGLLGRPLRPAEAPVLER